MGVGEASALECSARGDVVECRAGGTHGGVGVLVEGEACERSQYSTAVAATAVRRRDQVVDPDRIADADGNVGGRIVEVSVALQHRCRSAVDLGDPHQRRIADSFDSRDVLRGHGVEVGGLIPPRRNHRIGEPIDEQTQIVDVQRSERKMQDRFQQFDPVAERVVDVHPLVTLQRLIVSQKGTARAKSIDQRSEIIHQQRRVRLVRWPEVRVDAQMDLESSVLEPAATTQGEVWWLGDVLDPEKPLVEGHRLVLATCRHRQLHVVDRDDLHVASVTVGGVGRAGPSAVVGFRLSGQDRAMARWPVSDQDARDMYSSGRGDDTARWYARNWARVFRTGLLPKRWVDLQVPGRVSGRLTSYPLGMADVEGRWYLVSMLGECNWVKNVRAADGQVVLRRRRARSVTLVEVPTERRAPILRRYVDKVPGGRPHIPAPPGAPLSDFEAIADQYPVFEVDNVDQRS